MKSAQPRSTDVTCLINPPRHSALTVVCFPACSSVRSRVLKRRKSRCLASVSSRSVHSSGVVVMASSSVQSFLPSVET